MNNKTVTIESILENESLSPEAKIEKLKQLAYKALAEAESIADYEGLEIEWSLGYGLGGWYSSGEWNSSSSNC